MRDDDLALYSRMLPASMASNTASESAVLVLPDLSWSLKFYQHNFLNRLLTILWSIMPSPFIQQMFGVASAALRFSSNSSSSQIRHRSTIIWAAFKSHTEWSIAQRVSAPTTTILPTTAVSLHGLIYFGHWIYAPQTSIYQNTAKSETRRCNCEKIIFIKYSYLKLKLFKKVNY